MSVKTTELDRSTFADLGLSEPLCQAAREAGYESPTALQAKALPKIFAGNDAFAFAPAGSGRTVAWALPLLQGIDPEQNAAQVLVLAPNRRRCLSLTATLSALARGLELGEVLPLYDERPLAVQRKRLESGAQILVGTPERIADLMEDGALDPETLHAAVLDEASELDIDCVADVLVELPEEHQVMLFASAESASLREAALQMFDQPVDLSLAPIDAEHADVPVIGHDVPRHEKPDALARILERSEDTRALVFAGRTAGALELAQWLRARGFAAEGLAAAGSAAGGDADHDTAEGERALGRLADGELEALVLTDAAARDLEGDPVACVVHYDAAPDAAAWVARDHHVEEGGEVVVLRTPRERMLVGSVERELGLEVSLRPVPRGQVEEERSMVRLFVSAGRRDGVRPGDVVGAISNEADVPGRSIGSIDIYDRFTFVDVDVEYAEQVRERMGGKTLRGRTVDVRPATPRGEGEEDYEERPQGGRHDEKPQRGRSERGGSDRGRSDSRGGREAAPRRERSREDLAVLVVELGYRDGVRPGELVAAIAGEAEISGKDIGSIDISDELTFVEVPEDLREEVIERMDGALIRGREASFRLPTEDELSGELEQARAPRRDRSAPAPEPGMARLFISAGHNLGVRPADIVGAIANDAGVPGRDIGTIDIYDRYSFVEIPAEHHAQVLDRMSRATLRGRSVEFREATPRGTEDDEDYEEVEDTQSEHGHALQD